MILVAVVVLFTWRTTKDFDKHQHQEYDDHLENGEAIERYLEKVVRKRKEES